MEVQKEIPRLCQPYIKTCLST